MKDKKRILFVTLDGGMLCEHCVNAERPGGLDKDCPDDHQWWIIGSQEGREGEVCDHCYKTREVGPLDVPSQPKGELEYQALDGTLHATQQAAIDHQTRVYKGDKS